jgi:AraC family transcriptional regulator
MKNFMILTESIDYIERNLDEPISQNDIAKHCFVSLSMLQKLYRYALGMGIKSYISRRRMTQAAKDLVKGCYSVTDIAMKYQYGSVEVFSRAFKRVWGVNPSDFSEHWQFTGIFPKINFIFKEGDDLTMARKRVDLSEAYDYFKERKGSYVLCFDIQHLTAFNNISFRAGDLAILEMASRIDKAANDDMRVFRIGGDEFALITGLYDYESVVRLSEQVLAKNGEAIDYEGQKLPLSLWCGVTQIPESLRYSAFFTDMHHTIDKSKE